MKFLRRKFWRFGLILLANFLMLILLIILFEGTLNLFYFLKNLQGFNSVAEEIHTDYDPLIGWINKSAFYKTDMYGPGKNLTILADRSRLTATSSAKSQFKAICSGDSFVLGFGVADLSTWCSQLGQIKGWQTLNLGQGGYGLDQSYLWYSKKLEGVPHQLHIFGVNLYGISRTFSSTFLGYGKPYLVLENDQLINKNFPVPLPKVWDRFVANNGLSFRNLHLLNVFNQQQDFVAATTETETKNLILIKIIDEVTKLTILRGAQSVVVLIPTEPDYQQRYEFDMTASIFKKLAETSKFQFINLGDVMFALSLESYEALFIQPGATTFSGTQGHYNELGNQFIAHEIAKALNIEIKGDAKKN